MLLDHVHFGIIKPAICCCLKLLPLLLVLFMLHVLL